MLGLIFLKAREDVTAFNRKFLDLLNMKLSLNAQIQQRAAIIFFVKTHI